MCRRVFLPARVPPSTDVERVRIGAARRALVDGDATVGVSAGRTGFGTAETVRRAFHRHLGTPPSEYHDRFRGAQLRETA